MNDIKTDISARYNTFQNEQVTLQRDLETMQVDMKNFRHEAHEDRGLQTFQATLEERLNKVSEDQEVLKRDVVCVNKRCEDFKNATDEHIRLETSFEKLEDELKNMKNQQESVKKDVLEKQALHRLELETLVKIKCDKINKDFTSGIRKVADDNEQKHTWLKMDLEEKIDGLGMKVQSNANSLQKQLDVMALSSEDFKSKLDELSAAGTYALFSLYKKSISLSFEKNCRNSQFTAGSQLFSVRRCEGAN